MWVEVNKTVDLPVGHAYLSILSMKCYNQQRN